MTRIGLHGETDKIYGELKEISKLENIALEGIFTHYAVADSLRDQDEEYTKAQTEKILAVADKCEAEGLHLEKCIFSTQPAEYTIIMREALLQGLE